MNSGSSFKQKALQWADRFETCCLLDSNGYADKYGKYDWLLAAGAKHLLQANCGEAFQQLKAFYDLHGDYLFGFMSYDLKNGVENLSSENADQLGFPDLVFFVPEFLIACRNDQPVVLRGSDLILGDIEAIELRAAKTVNINITPKLDRAVYLEKIAQLKAHIRRGDIYEVNFCQEFFAEDADIDPIEVFTRLNMLSPTPFATFFRHREHFILSATPERFLSKTGEQLISQPIKGTARRSKDQEEDLQIKTALQNDPKEQTENVMIVDLVRNDLTKSAVKGTVATAELFGVYSFSHVHQLISTIRCTISPDIHIVDAIRNCFPMGSMTGAPKVRAMQLIEQYEESKRGIYSGTIGWIGPDQDFDFNVVIRTILYNSANKYLSFQVGGAITNASVAEKEYEECLVKAKAMIETLS